MRPRITAGAALLCLAAAALGSAEVAHVSPLGGVSPSPHEMAGMRLSSAEAAVQASYAGDYLREGDAHGYPLYRKTGSGNGGNEDRFLYRSPSGKWSITSSVDKVAKAKGTVSSLESGDTPVGLAYRFYARKAWTNDPTLEVAALVAAAPQNMTALDPGSATAAAAASAAVSENDDSASATLKATQGRPYVRLKEAIANRLVKEGAAKAAEASELRSQLAEARKGVSADMASVLDAAHQAREEKRRAEASAADAQHKAKAAAAEAAALAAARVSDQAAAAAAAAAAARELDEARAAAALLAEAREEEKARVAAEAAEVAAERQRVAAEARDLERQRAVEAARREAREEAQEAQRAAALASARDEAVAAARAEAAAVAAARAEERAEAQALALEAARGAETHAEAKVAAAAEEARAAAREASERAGAAERAVAVAAAATASDRLAAKEAAEAAVAAAAEAARAARREEAMAAELQAVRSQQASSSLSPAGGPWDEALLPGLALALVLGMAALAVSCGSARKAEADARASKAEAEARAAAEGAAKAAHMRALEEVVETLRCENAQAALVLGEQREEMDDLRRSVLELNTQVSDARRSQSSLNLLGGGGGGGGSSASAAELRLRSLRQSNQDILRQSKLNLTSTLRASRTSFSGHDLGGGGGGGGGGSGSSSVGSGDFGGDRGHHGSHQAALPAYQLFSSPAADKRREIQLPMSAPAPRTQNQQQQHPPKLGVPSRGVPLSRIVSSAAGSGDQYDDDAALHGGTAYGRGGTVSGGASVSSIGGGSASGYVDDENGYGGDGRSGPDDELDACGGDGSELEGGEVDDDELAIEAERLQLQVAMGATYASEEATFEFDGSIGIQFGGFNDFEGMRGATPFGAPIAVTHVVPGGAADGFGVKEYDLITALNGERLSPGATNDGFFELLTSTPKPVTLTFRQCLDAPLLAE